MLRKLSFIAGGEVILFIRKLNVLITVYIVGV